MKQTFSLKISLTLYQEKVKLFLLSRSQVCATDFLFVSHLPYFTYLSFATINICSRAGALGISNKCMNRSGV